MAFCSFSRESALFDSTPIENMFLVEYLPQAPDDCLRVYLYARMLCCHPEMGGEIGDIAKALHLDEDEVLDAFSFWERQGLVERMSDRPLTFSFRSLNSGVIAKENDEVRRHLDYNSAVLKALDVTSIGSKQTRMLYDWLDVLGYSQEAALKILEHEKKVSAQFSINTIIKRADKRAVEWAERGIHSLEDVEKAISYDDQVYSMAYTVLRQLGIGRKPSVDELNCVRRWVSEWKLSQQEVIDACVHTTKSRNPSIAYLDAILKDKVGGGNPHFENMKAVLKDLGAANATPTPEQIKKYSALLDAGFDPETLLLAAVQCAAKGWHTFDKLEWMLQEWGEAGVHSCDQAQAYLSNMQRMRDELRALYKNAGLVRSVYAKDIQLYESWKQKYSPEMILCAAQCSTGAREPTKYISKLLSEWEKAGITSPEAARAQHRNYQGAAAKAPAQSMNYQQHDYTREEYSKNFYYDPAKDYGEDGDDE